MEKASCKICGSSSLNTFAHTAKCSECGVLLYYPYPSNENGLVSEGTWSKASALKWYSRSSFFNHINFTNMIRFAMDESYKGRKIDILDYGGGGGQFALVFKSHYPESTVYITDINNDSLLDAWAPINDQIRFEDFSENSTTYDFIFLNDVFEHVSDPVGVLKELSGKLKDGGGIFIDTPRQFWIYPFAKFLSKLLYTKILRGTVSTAHLQIWSKESFNHAINESNLEIRKYDELTEYTMPADYYMNNMKISNPAIRLAGRLFYKFAKLLANNKIVCVLSHKDTH